MRSGRRILPFRHIGRKLQTVLISWMKTDVLVYCRNMLDKLDLDEDEIVNEKMSKNEAKYPVDKARGKADKYDKL